MSFNTIFVISQAQAKTLNYANVKEQYKNEIKNFCTYRKNGKKYEKFRLKKVLYVRESMIYLKDKKGNLVEVPMGTKVTANLFFSDGKVRVYDMDGNSNRISISTLDTEKIGIESKASCYTSFDVTLYACPNTDSQVIGELKGGELVKELLTLENGWSMIDPLTKKLPHCFVMTDDLNLGHELHQEYKNGSLVMEEIEYYQLPTT